MTPESMGVLVLSLFSMLLEFAWIYSAHQSHQKWMLIPAAMFLIAAGLGFWVFHGMVNSK